MSLGRFGQLRLALEPLEPLVVADVMRLLDRDGMHSSVPSPENRAELERAAGS